MCIEIKFSTEIIATKTISIFTEGIMAFLQESFHSEVEAGVSLSKSVLLSLYRRARQASTYNV